MGIEINENEDIYEGDFASGVKCGIGKWKNKVGDRFTGELSNNLFNGKVLSFSQYSILLRANIFSQTPTSTRGSFVTAK